MRRNENNGYQGMWIDDVNMPFNVSDGNGYLMAPTDFNTGTTMTGRHGEVILPSSLSRSAKAFRTPRSAIT